ncbi:MAG: hypothetical protein RJA13_698, partial [Bacteroidota bacterium]
MALTISPDKPVVAVGQRITLTANGAVGSVQWGTPAFGGVITGSGNQITYIASDKAGLDSVTARDDFSLVSVNIVVTQPQIEIKPENAQWDIFTNRDNIKKLAYDPIGKSIWVATEGGLEKRDVETGEVKAVFMQTDGLPSNNINALQFDNYGNLWVATYEGLAIYTPSNSKWNTITTKNSNLPNNVILTLHIDADNKLWLGLSTGIASYSINSEKIMQSYQFVFDTNLPGSGAKYSDKIYLENGKVRIDKTKNRSDMIDKFL